MKKRTQTGSSMIEFLLGVMLMILLWGASQVVVDALHEHYATYVSEVSEPY